MPPSLYLRTLPTVLSVKNGQHFILAPLTLALSPGRGNRFVDAAFRSLLNRERETCSWMLAICSKYSPTERDCEHNNQPYFQTPRFSKP